MYFLNPCLLWSRDGNTASEQLGGKRMPFLTLSSNLAAGDSIQAVPPLTPPSSSVVTQVTRERGNSKPYCGSDKGVPLPSSQGCPGPMVPPSGLQTTSISVSSTCVDFTNLGLKIEKGFACAEHAQTFLVIIPRRIEYNCCRPFHDARGFKSSRNNLQSSGRGA